MSEEANSPGQQKDNAQKAPLIVSVASGKGGVGKTRISLGLACDFARSFKTLIVDLDFFNRGMTGLLPKGRHVRWIDGPAFMAEEGVPEQWQLVQAQEDATEAENIYFLRYPDLTETQTMAFVSNSIATLEESLSNMFGTLAKEFGIEVIVLDCHGGPDNTSFAANGLANFSILVTDTDKASLHGTFNFVRQLEYVEGKPPQRTHIVFNRIPEDSNFRVLETMHDRYFRPRLGNQSKLLAAFPADRQVARASDKASLFPLLRSMALSILSGSWNMLKESRRSARTLCSTESRKTVTSGCWRPCTIDISGRDWVTSLSCWQRFLLTARSRGHPIKPPCFRCLSRIPSGRGRYAP